MRNSDWAAWPCATACSSTVRHTGPPPCAPTPARSRSRPGASRGLRAVDPIPGVRGVVRLAEAFAVIPLVKRSLPAAKLPFQDPGVALAVAAGASLGGTLLRRRLRGAGGEAAAAVVGLHARAVRAPRRRAGRLPRRRAQGDRRPTRPTPATRRTRRRSTTAAARTSSRRCSPPTSPAPCCCGARSSGRARSPAARSRSRRPRSPSRCSRGASATRRRALAKALRRPGFEIQRARRHARAGRAPARGRPRRAGRDPARRGHSPALTELDRIYGVQTLVRTA